MLYCVQVVVVLSLMGLSFAKPTKRMIDEDPSETANTLANSGEERYNGHSLENILNQGNSDIAPGTEHHQGRTKRKIKTGATLWEGGVVNYKLDTDSFGAAHTFVAGQIAAAISTIEAETCIRFNDITNSPETTDYVHILHSIDSCESAIGKSGGRQNLTLIHVSEDNTCAHPGIIMHEFMHALGFIHEQNRPDRDEHVIINMDNIESGKGSQFDIKNASTSIPYDYQSIMHYGTEDFAIFPFHSIRARRPDLEFLMGQREKMSFYDIKYINNVYSCEADCDNSYQNDGYVFKEPSGACVPKCPEHLTGSNCDEVVTDPNCGGKISLTSGQSIDITETPTPDADTRVCVWLITVPPGDLVRLEFLELDLAKTMSGNCQHTVEIRSNLIGQTGPTCCGYEMPDDSSTANEFSENKAMIIFTESASDTSGGSFTIRASHASNPDNCNSNPCVRGQCSTVNDAYDCSCYAGYTGQNCDVIDSSAEVVTDFEDGSLGILERMTAEREFQMSQGPTATSNTGPSSGSAGSETYIYFEASYPAKKDDEAKMKTLALPMDVGRCLKFDYHMHGTGSGSLDVSLEGASSLLTISGDQEGDDWITAEVDIDPEAGNQKVIFTATRDSYKLDIAIDNVITFSGPCSPGDCVCDFENPSALTCVSQVASPADTFDWIFTTLPSPSQLTGPDCASNGEGYLLFESSFRNLGDTADLQGQCLTVESCLSFSVYAYGDQIGSLNVAADGLNISPLAGEITTAKKWKNVKFSLPVCSTYTIEATSGVSYRGDIGIDNLSIKSGPCVSEPCDERPCLHSDDSACSNILDLTDPSFTCTCPTGFTGPTCDILDFDAVTPMLSSFELPDTNPFGIFNQVEDEAELHFDWSIGKNESTTSETGPKGAKTGTYYAFCDGSFPNPSGGSARIESSILPPASYCLSFGYHMYGSSINSLKVETVEGDDIFSEVWAKDGQQSVDNDDWKMAQVTIAGAGDFRISIECKLGVDSLSDIAIDDVILTQGACV